MTAPVFVDANVLVYARDSRDAAKQRMAMAWLEHLWASGSGRTSTQVLSEYFVTVTRKLPYPMAPDDAWDDVQALFCWGPQPIDREVLNGAMQIARRFGLSWWDSLVVSAAQVQDCPVLLSEDMQDGAVLAGVTIRSPFTFSVSEAPAAYGKRASARGGAARGPRARRSATREPVESAPAKRLAVAR
jgi:predicted nucleic acid-binding protein